MRHYAEMLYRLLEAPYGESFFLLGPRGSGKTTWLRAKLSGAAWFDLLDEGLYQELLVDPGLFGRRLSTLAIGSDVVVDEVQRLPNLLNEVHRFIESHKLRFALTGSSARKLRRTGTNLLAGRALQHYMYSLTPEELGATFELTEVLSHGSLALVWDARDKAQRLAAYVQAYLKEEIQAEAVTHNLASFARFLPVAALFHAQVLNVASLSRDVGAARSTVLGYLQVLTDTLFAFQLPAYEATLRVRERRHPKFYWVDPGIVRAIKRQLGPLTLEEKGPLFEGFIAQLLRTYQLTFGLFDELFYWATPSCEVDFLLVKGDEKLALEVKATARPRPEHFAGLVDLAALKGVRRRVMVCLVTHPERRDDGIEVWPLSLFLTRLREKRWEALVGE